MRLDSPAKTDETKFNSFLLKHQNNHSYMLTPMPRLLPFSLSLIGQPRQVHSHAPPPLPRLIMSLTGCWRDCLMKYECNNQARLKVKLSEAQGRRGSSSAVTRRVSAATQAGGNTNKTLRALRTDTYRGDGGRWDHSFIPKCYFYANERGRN